MQVCLSMSASSPIKRAQEQNQPDGARKVRHPAFLRYQVRTTGPRGDSTLSHYLLTWRLVAGPHHLGVTCVESSNKNHLPELYVAL